MKSVHFKKVQGNHTPSGAVSRLLLSLIGF